MGRYTWAALGSLLTVTVILQGCPGNSNPAGPTAPAPTAIPTVTATATSTPTGSWTLTQTPTLTWTPTPSWTPTFTFTPAPITWYSGNVLRSNYLGSITQQASLLLQFGGQPVTNALVVLTGSNISVPVTLPYNSPNTIAGSVYAQYSLAGFSWSYQAGQTYCLTSTISGQSVAATQVAPGGITVASDGSSASWSVAGNGDSLIVETTGRSPIWYSPSPIGSPYSIPVTVYPSSGTYFLDVIPSNEIYVAAAGNGYFLVEDQFTGPVTFNAPTSTPTFSPSPSPTITDTPTITLSPTPSFTTTPTDSTTNSPTNSSTPTPANTASWTPSATASATPSNTASSTATASPTSSATSTPTATYSATNSPTRTSTSTPTITATPTLTATNSPTATPTNSATKTPTSTITSTPTLTGTSTWTGTPTMTATPPSLSTSFTVGASAFVAGLRFTTGFNLWTVDSSNNDIQKWGVTGTGPSVSISTFNGGQTFNSPVGVGVDPTTWNVYVGDKGNSRFEVFSDLGNYLNTFGPAELAGQPAGGVAVNSAGTTVYALAVPNGGGSVLVYSIGGTSSSPTYTYQGSFGSGYLNLPSNLSLDSHGDVWVASQGDGKAVEFNSSGVYQKSISILGGISSATDVAVDTSDNVFVTDRVLGGIEEFNPSGQLINQFDLFLSNPHGLYLNGLNLLYIGMGNAVYAFNIQ